MPESKIRMNIDPSSGVGVTFTRSSWWIPSNQIRWLNRVAVVHGSVYFGNEMQDLVSYEKVLQQLWYDENDSTRQTTEWRDVPVVDAEITKGQNVQENNRSAGG